MTLSFSWTILPFGVQCSSTAVCSWLHDCHSLNLSKLGFAMTKNTMQKNPNAKNGEVVERIRKIKDSNIDMRDKRTAAEILLRKNSVSRVMQESNKLNNKDIGHENSIKKLLDDIFRNNKPIELEEVVDKSHDLQKEEPSINRGKSNKK